MLSEIEVHVGSAWPDGGAGRGSREGEQEIFCLNIFPAMHLLPDSCGNRRTRAEIEGFSVLKLGFF